MQPPTVLFVFCVYSAGCLVSGAFSSIKIGIISDGMTLDEEVALNFSLDYSNRVLLANYSVKMVAIRRPATTSEFATIQTVCSLLSESVSAIVGVLSDPMTRTISLTTTTYKMPLFAPKATNPRLASTATYPYLIRQSPPDSQESEAIVDLMQYFQWSRMAILTSNSENGLNGLVRLQNLASLKQWTIYSVQRFEASATGDDIDVRQLLLNIKSSGVRIIILHSSDVEGIQVLGQAADLGMTSAGWQWIVTHEIASSDLLLKSTTLLPRLQGLLGTALTVKQTAFSDQIRSDWKILTRRPAVSPPQGAIMDAVFSVAYASSSSMSRLQGESINCRSPLLPWSRGEDALLAYTQVSGDGMMGPIEYEAQQPKTAIYNVVSLLESRWENVGVWSSDKAAVQRLEMINKKVLKMGGAETVIDFISQLANKTLRVTFATDSGFLDIKPEYTAAYLKNFSEVPVSWVQGYCIDLLLKLQEIIGFNSSLYLVNDELYGRKDEVTGEWNGLVRELVETNADMAVGPITINHVRKADIDFTAPYIDLGLQFILKKKEVVQDSFRFFKPLSPTLWAYIGGTLFLVSFTVTLVNKISPYDYHGGFVQEDHKTTA